MPSGSLKKVLTYIAWLSADDAVCDRPIQEQKERLMSKLISNSYPLNESQDSIPASTNSGIGKLHENRVKLALDTVQRKTPENLDHMNSEPQSSIKDPALTSCNAKECSTKVPQIKRSPTIALSPGQSFTKRSKSTVESPRPPETSKLKFMYSGEQLGQERLASLSSLLILEQPTGWHLTPAGLMTMKVKKQSYSMTSMAPSPTQPSSGSWIEPNFDWKAKGVTLISWLKNFSSQAISNHQNGTIAVNILWMPYEDESTTNSTSSVKTKEVSSVVTASLSSGLVGEHTSE